MGSLVSVFLKGLAMGAANVIPGVSGGTIAFITGIYETFIDSLKSFDTTALKLAAGFRIRELATHLNLLFLVPLLIGVAVSILTLGKLLDALFAHSPVLVWSFFFGLILASVYFVSKSIKRWNIGSITSFLLGTAAALSMALLRPAAENDSFLYLALCGVIAVCSMILPGLSGSFVLILMGNYQLIMLRAVPNIDIAVIIPVGLGAAVGFIALSHLISYLLRRHHDTTLGALTGFILGSLAIIWPWKDEVFLLDADGGQLLKDGEPIVQGYTWQFPDFAIAHTWYAVALIIVGIVAVALLERGAKPN